MFVLLCILFIKKLFLLEVICRSYIYLIYIKKINNVNNLVILLLLFVDIYVDF